MGEKDSQAREFHKAFKAIVESRRSYKRPFSSETVEPGLIEECLDLARWAPSAHNEQPWRFILFYKQDQAQQAIRDEMLGAMEAKHESDLLAGGLKTTVASGQSLNSRFREAPVLILALLDTSVMDAYPDASRQQAERVMGEQSVAACLQTLLLALHVAGLKACWYCAPLFAVTTIRDVLQLPATMIPQAFIATGHGAATQEAGDGRKDGRMPGSTRTPVSEIIMSPFKFLHPDGDDPV